MDKFRFAPGLPGYGTKGIDGSAGLDGLMMLFTNLNPDTDSTIIRNKIINNQVLWSDSTAALPGGRLYQYGDIFVDGRGKIYEIRPAAYPYYEYMQVYLSAAQFFSKYIDTNTDFNTERWANTHDTYNIDSILTETALDYTQAPTKIYSIAPLNFNRIEYTDVEFGNYNPFSLFVASDTSDNDAIAIVRSAADNAFHIGNMNDSFTDVRPVDLVFDVRELRVSKNSSSRFTQTTPLGTVVTSYEMEANPLFTPNFNVSPTSFILGGTGDASIELRWSKLDFLNTTDTNIINNTIGNLYFYQKTSPYKERTFTLNSWNSDGSIYELKNIDASGRITIDALPTGTSYEAYIDFIYNGWHRASNILSKTTGLLARMDVSIKGSYSATQTFDASANRWFGADASYSGKVDVSTNVPWSVSIQDTGDGTNWVNIENKYGDGSTNSADVGHFLVSVSEKLTSGSRTAILNITGDYNPDPSIKITQSGTNTTNYSFYLIETGTDCWSTGPEDAKGLKTYRLTTDSGISKFEVPATTKLTVQYEFIAHCHTASNFPTGSGAHNIDYRAAMRVYKNGSTIDSIQSDWTNVTGANQDDTTTWSNQIVSQTIGNGDALYFDIYRASGDYPPLGLEAVENVDASPSDHGRWYLSFDLNILSVTIDSGETINIVNDNPTIASSMTVWTTGNSHCDTWPMNIV